MRIGPRKCRRGGKFLNTCKFSWILSSLSHVYWFLIFTFLRSRWFHCLDNYSDCISLGCSIKRIDWGFRALLMTFWISIVAAVCSAFLKLWFVTIRPFRSSASTHHFFIGLLDLLTTSLILLFLFTLSGLLIRHLYVSINSPTSIAICRGGLQGRAHSSHCRNSGGHMCSDLDFNLSVNE